MVNKKIIYLAFIGITTVLSCKDIPATMKGDDKDSLLSKNTHLHTVSVREEGCCGNEKKDNEDSNEDEATVKTNQQEQNTVGSEFAVDVDQESKHFLHSDTISIISSSSSTSKVSRIFHISKESAGVKQALSIEEKTEMWLAFLDHGCDLINYPKYALSVRTISTNSIPHVKNSFKELVQQYHCNQHGIFESHKVVSQLLIKYTGEHEDEIQTIKLGKLQNKTFEAKSIASELAASETFIITKFDLIDNQIADLEASIKEESLQLMNTVLLDDGVLTDRVRAYIELHYNSIVKEKDKFSLEELNKFCSKIVQYKTYGEFKKYLRYRSTLVDSFSDTVHRYYNKERFLKKLKYFILGINPEINKQSEALKKQKAELCRLRKEVKKWSCFFEITPIDTLVAEGYLEHFLLEDLDLSTQGLKKDKAIDKVYMLVYASDDICNACTNAIPKVQSLISEKFQQQGVTVDPSDIDVLYFPISEKEEVDLDKLIMKRIK